MSLYRRPRRGFNVLYFVGWLFVVGVGIGLVWYGFTWNGKRKQADETPVVAAASATPEAAAGPTISPLPPGVASVLRTPTPVPLPTATPLPTAAPATPTSTTPHVVVGTDGVNVRSGPGINYTKLGHLDPGAQADLTGRHADWWQILYNGAPAWVFGQLVTVFDADNVPQVEPPTAPTAPPAAPPPTAAPTAPSPTETPSNLHGLVTSKFVVRDAGGEIYAPGPFAINQAIWCDWNVKNTSGEEVAYTVFGPWVEEADFHKPSWSNWHLNPGEVLDVDDHLEIGKAGTYNIWLRICFVDIGCVNLAGPVVVNIE